MPYIVIAGIAWAVIFWIYILTEPYGSGMSGWEKEHATKVFMAGGVVFLFIGFVLDKSKSSVGRMLSTPIRQKAKDFVSERMKKEIKDYIVLLKSADDEEVGLALVLTSNYAQKYLKDTGIDLYEPAVAVQLNPYITFEFSTKIEKYQSEGDNISAAPLLAWGHTLRAITNHQVRDLGREMWGELQRGLPYIDEKIEAVEIVFGEVADISRAKDIPVGLTPREQKTTEAINEKSISTEKLEVELENLKSLFEKGLLSKSIYETEQKKLLNRK